MLLGGLRPGTPVSLQSWRAAHHSMALPGPCIVAFFVILKIFFYLMCTGVLPVCLCEGIGSPELELQLAVSCQWVLGIDPGSSGRAARALTC